MCDANLSLYMGERMHPNDPKFGFTLSCPNPECPCQEVSGHGDNEKEAYAVIQHKFGGG
jgi:hypothetical protein